MSIVVLLIEGLVAFFTGYVVFQSIHLNILKRQVFKSVEKFGADLPLTKHLNFNYSFSGHSFKAFWAENDDFILIGYVKNDNLENSKYNMEILLWSMESETATVVLNSKYILSNYRFTKWISLFNIMIGALQIAKYYINMRINYPQFKELCENKAKEFGLI